MRKAISISVTVVLAVISGEVFVTVNPAFGMVFHSVLLFSFLTVSVLLRGPAFRSESGETREDKGSTEPQEVVSAKNDDVNSESLDLSSSIFSSKLGSEKLSNFFLAVAIVPLIRIFSLSMPLWFFPEASWYIIIALPMLAAALSLAHYQNLGAEDLGLTSNRLPLQIILGFTGVAFGFVEYFILEPEPLVESLVSSKALMVSLVLLWGTGFTEELAFRGVLQKNAIESFGVWRGLLLVALVFAALHIGHSPMDAIFVFPIALFYGLLVWKTKSIVGATLFHGITNIILFVVAPLLIA